MRWKHGEVRLLSKWDGTFQLEQDYKHLNSIDLQNPNTLHFLCFFLVSLYYVDVENMLNASNIANLKMVQERCEKEFCEYSDVATSHGKLGFNSSDIALIGQQFFHDSRHQVVSHLTENSWGQR